jgi:hypothetical protein
MGTIEQLDIFGAVEAAADTRTAAKVERDRLQARFDQLTRFRPDGSPVTWTAPYDTSDGSRAGTVRPALRCWICGRVEVGDYQLGTNHDLYPADVDRAREQCARQRLIGSQIASARHRNDFRLVARLERSLAGEAA